MNCIPESLTVIDWIPVDELAHIILDLVHTGYETHKSEIFNLVNPKVTDWSNLVPTIQIWFAVATKIVAVPFADWIDMLKHVDPNDKNEVASKPAVKIIDFYAALDSAGTASHSRQIFEIENGLRASKTMATLMPVNKESMETWLRQWNF